MFNFINLKKNISIKLYNKILLLSRNKLFYTQLSLKDTFQNRINLIFLHVSFLFIRINNKKENEMYKKYYQEIFDIIFRNIELNMREIGHGDVTVNKNMKFLVKDFYNILLNCENYSKKTLDEKNTFLLKYLRLNEPKIAINSDDLVYYFDKYQAFCFDLSSDSVIKGDLNFTFNKK